MKFLATAVLALVVAAALPAAADSVYTWNFATIPNQSLGTTTYNYTTNGLTITATGSSNLFLQSRRTG